MRILKFIKRMQNGIENTRHKISMFNTKVVLVFMKTYGIP